MSLHRLRLLLLVVLGTVLVSACGGGGGGGSPAPAPQNLVATAGDTQVTLTWDTQPGVEYWMWYKAGTDVTPGGSNTAFRLRITSPYVLAATNPALVNGTTYAFIINGRIDNGPGGPPSNVATATPGFAGVTWRNNGSFGSSDMHGVAYGLTPGSSTAHSYVAIGDAGSLYKSPAYTSTDALTWTAVPTIGTPLAGINLKAILYTHSKYIVVGASGVAYSTNLTTWTAPASGTTPNLNALASNGSTIVAVGDGGTIIHSTDGGTWTAATTNPATQNLHGVAWSAGGRWVAVGDNGTLVTSTDGITWALQASGTAENLHAVSAVTTTISSVTTYLVSAVGANGAVTTSTDGGLNWTAQTLTGTPDLTAVFAATRLVAVGAAGAIFSSEDGTAWTSRTSPLPTTTMYGLIREQNVFTAVGAAGSSLYSY